MASRPLRYPSCGGILPAVGTACPACGFTVWPADGGVAGGAVDAVVDEPVDRASGGWAAAPPSPPLGPASLSSITPPLAVDLPPSQVSVDGLDIHWSSGFPRRAAWGASAPVRALPAVAPTGSGAPRGAPKTGAPASGAGRQDGVAAIRSAGAPAGRATRDMPASPPATAAGAPAAVVPASMSPPLAGFDQVLSSDFRGAAAISSGAPLASPSSATQPRWAPSGASAIEFPGWFRGISGATGPSPRRPTRRRAPLPRAGVWLGVAALLLVGLLVFAAYAQRWSIRQGAGSVGAPAETVTIAAPRSADLATVRRELAGLASIASPASAQITTSGSAAARHASTRRTRLIVWRDRFELGAHQTRVLDNAIVYAGALARWLETPGSVARHAAALKAWRVWRADDPGLRAR